MGVSNDNLRPIRDLRVAVLFLTRVPVGRIIGLETESLARAAWAFPLAGSIVGGISGGVLYAVAGTEISPLGCALVALAVQVFVTGALHEDGIADVADGLGAHVRERTLEIMRDSRIGAYGVLALIFSVGLRAAMISGIPGPGFAFAAILAAAMVSRGVLPLVMHMMPPARMDGLSKNAGQPDLGRAALALAIGLAGLFTLLPLSVAFSAIVIAAVLGGAVLWWAHVRLGGQTGDVLGALQQVTEIAVYVAAAAGSSVFYV
ncbi:MAG: adenosylcobinamide-GDP ribazoletransferase [Rhodospirillales bacterium]|nr:adenosylcobinamide-GDP ribazoletransferase [Rhodospirillales bacterium]